VAALSVLIPSRLERDASGKLFLERAVASIRGQTGHDLALQILVGVDADATPPAMPGVSFVRAEGRSQAAALNAAADKAAGDFIAILEDDDQWNSGFLFCAYSLLKSDVEFSSSTQLEVTPDGKVIRVQEFPTPSGWMMRRGVWDRVGPFSQDYRFHLDNEWLGRLGETKARRAHLVEATTPMDYDTLPLSRPFLGRILEMANVELVRHDSPWPLVVRLCHPNSGMARIKSDPALKAQSDEETARLIARFGRFPW
jgi:hypothetical protein